MTTQAMNTWNSRFVGKIAGSPNSEGYYQIYLNNKSYKSHKLAYFVSFGRGMDEIVDHINQDKSDNRLCNLRIATKSQNNHNSKARSDNTSGAKGVSWHKGCKKWIVRIDCAKKPYHVGTFSNFDEAVKAAKDYRKKLHGDFACHH